MASGSGKYAGINRGRSSRAASRSLTSRPSSDVPF